MTSTRLIESNEQKYLKKFTVEINLISITDSALEDDLIKLKDLSLHTNGSTWIENLIDIIRNKK